MLPELFRIGPFALRSWGLAMATSVLVAVFIAIRRSKRFGVDDPNVIYDLVIVVVLSAIAGSRIFYIVFHLDEFSGNWVEAFTPFSRSGSFGCAGLSMMGGVFLSIIAVAVYAKVKKLNFQRVSDVIAPTFLLGAGITRIGCFLNGCCFGRPTSSWFGIAFHRGAAGEYLREFIHSHPEAGACGLIPTQIIASLLSFALFFLVLYIERWRSFDGFTAWSVMMLYCCKRFFLDQFRFYEPEQIIAELGPILITVNEIVLLVIFLMSVFMFARGYSRRRVGVKK